MTDKIKPCPFCGCDNIEYYEGKETTTTGNGSNPMLCCKGCGIGFTTGYYGHGVTDEEVKNDTIRHWNARK